MRVELDMGAGIITVDGVRISLDLLKHLANPDPKQFYSMIRTKDEVTVMRVDSARYQVEYP